MLGHPNRPARTRVTVEIPGYREQAGRLVCDRCGAVVGDIEAHDAWHRENPR